MASTNRSDLGLNPFTGTSASDTGLVAYYYDRSFIGINTEQEYLDISIKWFEELTNNHNLFGWKMKYFEFYKERLGCNNMDEVFQKLARQAKRNSN